MSKITKIEVPVAEATAAALADAGRLEAVGRLLDRLVQPRGEGSWLALLEQTAAEAQAAGLTDEEVEAELAAYNAERRG